MTGVNVDLWSPKTIIPIADSISNPTRIVSSAIQLRERERKQLAQNFRAENYEVAASFVWLRSMAILKKQLSLLGMEFIGELLQRPDIDEYSDIQKIVSDGEAISLARDLGMISALQTKRLYQSQEIVSHFVGLIEDLSSNDDEIMTKEEAISCLRVCVQGILGHEQISVAEDFKKFREKLRSETLDVDAPEIVKLKSSPYFFVRTAISVLLTLIKSSKGAQFEHASRNTTNILPQLWGDLKDPERWQVGQVYAVEFSEGNKEAVKSLHAALLSVSGFDYVPENLRSNTFIKVASSVITAHQGMNNFYNEFGPIRELASLGTSIPGPALAICITAVLCIKLGNFYGFAYNAQEPADRVISRLSKQRWLFYLDGRLENDRIILAKLVESKPLERWIALLSAIDFSYADISNRDVRALMRATKECDTTKVKTIAQRLFATSVRLT